MRRINGWLILTGIGVLAGLLFFGLYSNGSVKQEENTAKSTELYDEDEVKRSNYDFLMGTDIMSPEGVEVLIEECWLVSENGVFFNPIIASAVTVEAADPHHQGELKTYIEIITDDETHLFFLVPGYRTKYANVVSEIWKDSIGGEGTSILSDRFIDDIR